MLLRLGMLMAAVATVLSPPPARAWRQEIYGGRAVAVTAAGGAVVATGSIGTPDTARDFAVLKYDAVTGAELWRYTRDGSATPAELDQDEGVAVAVDAMGDVVAAGRLHNAAATDFVVVKLAGGTGTEIWRVEIDGTFSGLGESDQANALALDGAGNVVAVGHLSNASAAHDLLVVKLANANGAQLWRVDEDDGGFEDGRTVALDGSGNVLVGGVLDGTASVMKLAAATGGELWRAAPDARALALVLDGAGNVAAVVQPSTSSPALSVVKLAGASGAESWRNAVPGLQGDDAAAAAVDGAGDVVVAAGLPSPPGDVFPSLDLGVVKLAGASGVELWRRAIDGTRAQSNNEIARAVAVDGAGDVVAAGSLFNAVTSNDLAVVKLAGASGDIVWLAQVDDDGPYDDALALAVDAGGNPVAAGLLAQDFAVLHLAADDGGIGPLRGKKLLVLDDAGDAIRRKIVGRLQDGAVAVPPPGSAGDPTASGATLRLVNPTTAETASLPLPASLWRGLGNPAGSRGYEYRDSGTMGPCRLVRVRSGQVAASCNGHLGTIPYSLDEPTQGSLTLSVELGATEPQCATFGGVITDAGTANPGPTGRFRARNAPAVSGDCP